MSGDSPANGGPAAAGLICPSALATAYHVLKQQPTAVWLLAASSTTCARAEMFGRKSSGRPYTDTLCVSQMLASTLSSTHDTDIATLMCCPGCRPGPPRPQGLADVPAGATRAGRNCSRQRSRRRHQRSGCSGSCGSGSPGPGPGRASCSGPQPVWSCGGAFTSGGGSGGGSGSRRQLDQVTIS